MTSTTLVLATTNPGKVEEFRALLTPLLDLSRVRLALARDLGVADPPVEETGMTFAENALLKAVAYAAATGCAALADDSGLCVDALGGAPGLFSARWAGASATDAERNALLLRQLQDVPGGLRTARFVCAAALATPEGGVYAAEGVCHGLITHSPTGAEGFGYDPVFLLPEFRATMAELEPERKNTVSHRARALKSLLPLFPLNHPSSGQ